MHLSPVYYSGWNLACISIPFSLTLTYPQYPIFKRGGLGLVGGKYLHASVASLPCTSCPALLIVGLGPGEAWISSLLLQGSLHHQARVQEPLKHLKM